jgi:glycine betaine/choline ABC-type transport system substrate-binding protein
MHVLIRKKATLDTYEQVMRWHLEETGDLGRYEPLGRSKHFISREKLMQKLRKRYNMDKKYAKPHVTLLPHSNTKVTIWKKLARDR